MTPLFSVISAITFIVINALTLALKLSIKLCIVAKEEDGTMWFCKHCRTSVPGVKKMTIRVTKVEETQSHVLKRLDNLEKQLKALMRKLRLPFRNRERWTLEN